MHYVLLIICIFHIHVDEHQHTTSSTSSGLMKQLMLSLSVQLINSKEEMNTLNEVRGQKDGIY